MAVKCIACGKFIADADLDKGHFHHEPLSHFGPEVKEWTCAACVEDERRVDELTAEHGSWKQAR